MSLFVCPVCKSPLNRKGSSYVCRGGHSFDISREGYVNLLQSNRKHSKNPGDDKDMAAARRIFLSKGYYAPLRDELCALVSKYAPASASVLDLGCGEGYYTDAIHTALKNIGCNVNIAGIDISKFILKSAAKRNDKIEFAVASSFDIPVGDETADIIIDCFSPLALGEFLRVLKRGGIFIYVVPGRRHLWELKEVLYRHPYENEEKTTPYNGFTYEKIVPVRSRMDINSREDLDALFRMTPYFWKTPAEGYAELRSLERLFVTAEFNIHIYRKN